MSEILSDNEQRLLRDFMKRKTYLGSLARVLVGAAMLGVLLVLNPGQWAVLAAAALSGLLLGLHVQDAYVWRLRTVIAKLALAHRQRKSS